MAVQNWLCCHKLIKKLCLSGNSTACSTVISKHTFSLMTFFCSRLPQEAIESGQAPPKSSGFSFKGLSSMLFGAETPDVLETKINNLDEQINDSEETLKATKEDLRLQSLLFLKCLLFVNYAALISFHSSISAHLNLTVVTFVVQRF